MKNASGHKNGRVAKKDRDKRVYLTTRVLSQRSQSAARAAATESMAVMGYLVVQEGDWIVRKYPDGSLERISPIASSSAPMTLD